MRIHHLALRTRDLPRLERFYVDALGFEVTRRQDQSVWLDAGGAIVMLERAGDEEPAVPGDTKELVAFAIDASEHTLRVERLARAGHPDRGPHRINGLFPRSGRAPDRPQRVAGDARRVITRGAGRARACPSRTRSPPRTQRPRGG
jgi:catechol 2,3-dioxygenase-like lactoylglutathione lyase family enzyme